MDVAALPNPAVVSGSSVPAALIHLELPWFSESATRIAEHREAC